MLAGRKTTGTIRGDIWVNGHPKVQDTFKRVCGYVEQFGAPFSHLKPTCAGNVVLAASVHGACSVLSRQVLRNLPCGRPAQMGASEHFSVARHVHSDCQLQDVLWENGQDTLQGWRKSCTACGISLCRAFVMMSGINMPCMPHQLPSRC